MIAVIGAARPAPPAAIPSATSMIGIDARLVVGEVDDHDARAEPEQVEPARRMRGRRGEVDEPVADLVERGAHPACAPGRGQRVRHVVPRQPADRDRDARDLDDPRGALTLELRQPAIAHDVGASAARDVPAHDRRHAPWPS